MEIKQKFKRINSKTYTFKPKKNETKWLYIGKQHEKLHVIHEYVLPNAQQWKIHHGTHWKRKHFCSAGEFICGMLTLSNGN